MPDPLNLSHLESLLAKATPGEWKVDADSNRYLALADRIKVHGDIVINMPYPPFLLGHAGALVTGSIGRNTALARAQLIVDLVNAAPALIAAARRNVLLEAAVVAMKDWIEFRGRRIEPIDDEHRQSLADTDHELCAILAVAISKLEYSNEG